jgi:hypothetical protein
MKKVNMNGNIKVALLDVDTLQAIKDVLMLRYAALNIEAAKAEQRRLIKMVSLAKADGMSTREFRHREQEAEAEYREEQRLMHEARDVNRRITLIQLELAGR